MAVDREVLRGIEEGYRHAVLVFLDAEGYPMSVATDYRVDSDRGAIILTAPAGRFAGSSTVA